MSTCDFCILQEAPSIMGVSDLHDLNRNSVQSQDTTPHCLFSPDSISEDSRLSSGESLDKNVDSRVLFFSPGTWIKWNEILFKKITLTVSCDTRKKSACVCSVLWHGPKANLTRFLVYVGFSCCYYFDHVCTQKSNNSNSESSIQTLWYLKLLIGPNTIN